MTRNAFANGRVNVPLIAHAIVTLVINCNGNCICGPFAIDFYRLANNTNKNHFHQQVCFILHYTNKIFYFTLYKQNLNVLFAHLASGGPSSSSSLSSVSLGALRFDPHPTVVLRFLQFSSSLLSCALRLHAIGTNKARFLSYIWFCMYFARITS
uniref:Uncharacterized protein n=1 Tax=Anticarsia gemmatalis multiple nucleopolyhedrovirus TaxID=268591 RepID=A0A455KGF4_9ABAC|nr:hypothetical protein [Anticarsia gemmatalis multiple nucleopolyhedrovirus]